MDGSGDRRPIAARNMAIVQRMADALVRRGASADGISLAGMVAGVLAGLCLAAVAWLPDAARPFWILAGIFVQLRLLANLLDGMVAIGRGIASPAGELFNEVPDRVSDSAVFLGLGVAAGDVALGLAAALAAMATAYVRAVGKAAGAPSDFRGPMAKQHRMALVTAMCAWCAVMPLAWSWHMPLVVLWVVVLFSLVTAWRRLSAAWRFLKANPR
jgi:phosphatidylglycerophosphate synthase